LKGVEAGKMGRAKRKKRTTARLPLLSLQR
jgi:hypothetical protein